MLISGACELYGQNWGKKAAREGKLSQTWTNPQHCAGRVRSTVQEKVPGLPFGDLAPCLEPPSVSQEEHHVLLALETGSGVQPRPQTAT